MKKRYRLKKSFKRKLKIVFAVVATYIILRSPLLLKINGEKKIYVEAGDEYTDLGCTNLLNKNVRVESDVDTSKPGKYHVCYYWLTEKAKRTVYVVDTTGPEFNISNQDVYILEGETYNDDEIKAIDIVDGDLTEKIVKDGNIDTKITGDYTIKYTAEDSSDNVSSLLRNIHVVSKNKDYSSRINNNCDADSDIVKTIKDFYNTYFTSIRFLKSQDFSLIIQNDFNLYRWQKSLDLLIDIRKSSNINLSLYDCSYSLNIESEHYSNDCVEVYVMESANYLFSFNIADQAQTYNILNIFTFNSSGDLIDVYKEEGFNGLFEDCETIREVDTTYLKNYENNLEKQEKDNAVLKEINNGNLKYESSRMVQTPYDREKAVEYANEYALKRNRDYIECESNCVNFVSQCMHAGGIRMIYTGTYQWKCYGIEYNRNNEQKGHTNSWTYIPSYIVTLEESDEIITETELNKWYAEPGDCLMMYSRENHQSHAVLCTKVVKDKEGNIIELLFSGNTNDMKNYPLSAVVTWDVECEKILGCN